MTLAAACVVIAPAPARAHGVPAPTASTFEAVATPHSFRAGSWATIENVLRRATAPGGGSPPCPDRSAVSPTTASAPDDSAFMATTGTAFRLLHLVDVRQHAGGDADDQDGQLARRLVAHAAG